MILAIETSTPDASLALFDSASGRVVWQAAFTSDRAHNAAVFAPLDEALDQAGAGAGGLEAIVVGTGPGSYSGVRVGIAVANGVSLARAVPCFGMSSLAALPTGDGADDYRVIGDARRGEFYLAEVRGRELQGDAEMMSAEQLVERLQDGGVELAVFSTEESVVASFESATLLRPTAAELAGLAARAGSDRWSALEKLALEPIYLRAPHITVAKNRI